jgi:3-hydroxybutyryl-CoA dehydrogenase
MSSETAGRAAGAPAEVPSTVAVVGGGRMGSGIAHAFLLAGADVAVVERDAAAVAAAALRVERAVAKSASLGKLAEDQATVLERFTAGTDPAAAAGRGLVVEAVPEDMDLKRATLRRFAVAAGPDAVMATNTSSLSISALAEAVERPERVLGLHFFNPVPASSLVEVVVAPATAPGLADQAASWVEALGKTPIVVRDRPGFASSRLGVALALEAMRMVEESVASAEDIDQAMVLGYRFEQGPLRTTDLVGLDVRLGIAEYLHATLGERFAPPQILRDKVARGDLGRKSGEGFFRW